MEEEFLQWISIIPGVGPQRVRRLKEAGFTTPESIRDASIEDIAGIEGIGRELAKRLKDYAEEIVRLKEDETFLFLCPECGSFISQAADRCEVCGAVFETEELEEEELAPEPEILEEEEEPELYICPACGRFIGRGVRKCPHCNVSFEEEPKRDQVSEELMKDLEKQLEDLKGEIKTPLEDLEEYLKEEPLEKEPEEEKAIAKDFLKRWKRVTEEEEEEGARKLEEELRHYDSLLEADPTLERAWEKRAMILVELSRLEEAIECYDKLAELNPDREEEYKLEVLSLVKEKEGREIPPLEPEEPILVDAKEAIERVIAHYDELLRIDPSLKQAWQTRGELLEKIGRHAEAVASYDRAIECSKRERLRGIMELASLRKKGLIEGRTSSKGLIQGMGRTNGLVNGMVNGRVNGLVNGRGRVNGLVNGLVNGMGRVNGLVNGLVNGMGRVNGLVNGLINGNGLVNGRGAKHAPRFGPTDIDWPRALGTIAVVMSILVVVPLLYSLAAPMPPPSPIAIDGEFKDWVGIQSFADPQLDQTTNPDINVVSYKAKSFRNNVYVYARVEGVMLNGSGDQGVDSIFIFIDKDDDPSTGYQVSGLGADSLLEIYGWNNSISKSSIYEFSGETSQDDWNLFRRTNGVRSSIGLSEMETRFQAGAVSSPKILVVARDKVGNLDFADAIVSPDRDTLKLVQTTIASDVISSGGEVHFLRLDVDARNGGAHISQINITKNGNVSDLSVALNLSIDTNDDNLPDQLIASADFDRDEATLDVDIEVTRRMVLIATAVFSDPTTTANIGLRVSGIASNATVSLQDGFVTSVYVDGVPDITIDGAFGDWASVQKGIDIDGDVVMKGQTTAWINENIDLRSFAVDVDANISFSVSVDGRMMGGVDIPTFKERPSVQPRVVDSDRDSVPDQSDWFPNDFNNDAIPDVQTGNDVDGDGLTDYPWGPDFWLNTTIPIDFPQEYANRTAIVYIGPVTVPELVGADVLSIFLDKDNESSTGLPLIVGSQTYGIDFLLVVSGRDGASRSAGLYRYAIGNIPWVFVEEIPRLAFDTKSMELSMPSTSLQLDPDFSAVFHIADWRGDSDSSDQAAGRSRGDDFRTRSPAGDNVVLNEIDPVSSVEWIELANPTSGSIDLTDWEIQVKTKGKWTTVYTFGAVSIGAWLSGNEYLTVNLPPDSIKDKPTDCRLLDSTGAEVDLVNVPKLKAGESLARFKSGTDGKPEDTDDDHSDLYISTEPTRGKYNDRRRPMITVDKTADTDAAAPGDHITYTIYYDNLGGGIAKDVWINDTLPSEVTFVSSSEPYAWSSGRNYHWNFTNVAPGSYNSFTITVQVNDGINDGAQFNNFVELNYTDVFREPMEWSSANRTTDIVRPVITVEKIADVTEARQGDTITYTIYYNNTGNGTAAHVWVNDTIPVYTTFQDSSETPESIFGMTYVFHFYDVRPGSNSFTITVTVNATAPDGVYITNWAFLNYTTESEYPLEESSDSAVVRIPEFDAFLIPIIGMVVIFAWNKRKKKRRTKAFEE